MKTCALVAIIALITPAAGNAQQIEPVPYAAPVVDATVIPANTEVLVSLNEELTSRTARQGKVFDVSVSRDVMAGGLVAIPRGTLGHGEVVFRTGRGAFGKSGKMEIKLQNVVLGGRIVPLGGRFREEGAGNTGATIGAVLAAGVIAGALVTGRSAVFAQGREFRGYTLEALALGGSRPVAVASLPVQAPVMAAMSPRFTVSPVGNNLRPVAPAPRRTYAIARAPEMTSYERELAAQQGVHGQQAQGWSISD
jgi:hypothetical protein